MKKICLWAFMEFKPRGEDSANTANQVKQINNRKGSKRISDEILDVHQRL